jgi:hypothetical protein
MKSVRKEELPKKGRPSGLAKDDGVQVSRVKRLFEGWLQDSSGYDEDTWPQLKTGLECQSFKVPQAI